MFTTPAAARAFGLNCPPRDLLEAHLAVLRARVAALEGEARSRAAHELAQAERAPQLTVARVLESPRPSAPLRRVVRRAPVPA